MTKTKNKPFAKVLHFDLYGKHEDMIEVEKGAKKDVKNVYI